MILINTSRLARLAAVLGATTLELRRPPSIDVWDDEDWYCRPKIELLSPSHDWDQMIRRLRGIVLTATKFAILSTHKLEYG